ncbi:MAG: efflux RND transporter periplasmic adaptor subunit [candidate division WOR-3 bacterium]
MKRRITIFVFGVVAMSIVACNGRRQRQQILPPAVNAVTVAQRTVTRSIQVFGILQGEQQTVVTSKITGRVTEIVKPEGSFVKENEPIGYVVNDIPGMDYKPGPVRSPISGVVGKVYVEPGQMVSPTMPFAAIARFSNRIKMKAAVSDADLPFIRRGAKATVSFSAFPDTTFTGLVTQVAPMLDPQSRSATVEITIPNASNKLVPGMAGMARLIVEEKRDVVAVPLSALFTTDETRIVVIENDTARYRSITIGLRGDEWVEVTSGLEPGERVATIGKERVKAGEKVMVVEADKQ